MLKPKVFFSNVAFYNSKCICKTTFKTVFYVKLHEYGVLKHSLQE